MKEGIKEIIISIGSIGFMLFGGYLIITGDLTNGLLSIIVGELIDISFAPQYTKDGLETRGLTENVEASDIVKQMKKYEKSNKH